MQYTLITKTGKIYTFFLEATAKQYQLAFGGVVITPQIVDQSVAH
jgi:hypothetical protein